MIRDTLRIKTPEVSGNILDPGEILVFTCGVFDRFTNPFDMSEEYK